MSFKLRAGESLRKGLRRVLRKQLEHARESLLGAKSRTRDEAIHEARKSLKRARAVLRVVRPEIGEETFREANQCLRDFARPLSELRDAKVLVEVLSQLERKYGKKVAAGTIRHVRKVLEAGARRSRQGGVSKGRMLRAIGKQIRGVEPAVKEWTDVPNKWSSLGDGIEQSYRRAGKAFSQANSDQQIDTLHEWRKQVKYVRYQLELLSPIWPERIEQLAAEARQMTDMLGDDHDLALLAEVLREEAETFQEKTGTDVLIALVHHRQRQLRSKALLLGQRFFEMDAEEFVRLLKGYWRTWQRLSPGQDGGIAAIA